MRRILVATGLLFVLGSCGGGGSTGRIVFELVLSGLTDLGDQRGHYEGWAVVNGFPISTGKFIVNEAFVPARVTSITGHRVYGTLAGATFGPAVTALGSSFPFITSATHFFVTIEPEGDSDGAPSGNVIIAGEIIGESAVLSFTGDLAVGTPANSDLSMVSGDCLLINPTGDGVDANGVWFSAQPAGSTGISLPPAAGSWEYEGWVIDAGTGDRYSTGKFRATGRFDIDAQTAPTRGTASIGLLDPGQDFVNAATIAATQATDLADGSWRVFITVEPSADNAAGPFGLRVLDADIPTAAIDPMTGLVAMDVVLNDLSMSLPQLDVMASPGSLSLTGHAPGELGPATAGLYALWADVGGAIELVARFVVDDTAAQVTSVDGMTVFGTTTAFSFDSMNTGLSFPAVENATAFFITLEPQDDPEPGPSEHVVLDGVVQSIPTVLAGSALLTVAGAGLGIADFTLGITGSFVTMTPTDNASGVAANDGMGLWFRTLVGGAPSLALPVLPPQWRYEAWVENPAGAMGPFSLGRFSYPDAADEDAMTWSGRGSENTGFNVPGQDFLVSDPGTAIPGPLDLTSGFDTAITLEPYPDNDSGPSPFTILDGPLPAVSATPSTPLVNRVGATFPAGMMMFDK